MSRRKPPLTDDEILEWWELHAAGISIEEIARRFDRTVLTVQREFEELGIPRHWNDLSEREQRIAEALGRIGVPDDDILPERRYVQFARSMQHVMPSARMKRVPMSKRQRAQDAMATASWRRVVAANMRQAGLLPRYRRTR